MVEEGVVEGHEFGGLRLLSRGLSVLFDVGEANWGFLNT